METFYKIALSVALIAAVFILAAAVLQLLGFVPLCHYFGSAGVVLLLADLAAMLPCALIQIWRD